MGREHDYIASALVPPRAPQLAFLPAKTSRLTRLTYMVLEVHLARRKVSEDTRSTRSPRACAELTAVPRLAASVPWNPPNRNPPIAIRQSRIGPARPGSRRPTGTWFDIVLCAAVWVDCTEARSRPRWPRSLRLTVTLT